MKLTSICILLVCLLAASFSQGLTILSFNINQSYIANSLCVNRNNPKAHCNGHCYLKKELNNEAQPQSPLNATGKEKLEVQLFFAEGDPFNFARFDNNTIFNPHAAMFTPQQVLHKCFRPPCA